MKKTLIFLCLATWAMHGCNPSEESTSPNIIYVLADDMGIGDVAAFNADSKIPTPNLDRLAASGMRFTDAHTSSAVCTPTRYGILTGRYNWRSTLKQGVLSGKSKALIPSDRTTVASLLKNQGYQTAFIGKWHLGWDWALKDPNDLGALAWNERDSENIDFTQPITNGPNDLGFTYSYGHPASLDIPPYVYMENDRVTQVPTKFTKSETKYGWWRDGPTSDDFIHEQVTPHFFEKSIQYIQESAAREAPFFLYLALPSPHTPILPTREWMGKSGVSEYADFVMQVDHHMGELMAALEATGQSSNTLVLFTADNGCSPAAGIPEMQEQGHYPSHLYRGHKADIYEGGHRVPFIASWPDKIAANSVTDQLVVTTDLLSTVASITGYELADHEGEDSFSMIPAFLGGTMTRPAAVHHSINGSFALRQGDWKLIMAPGSAGWSFPRPGRDQAALDSLPPLQLYNLAADPGETQNLQAENPEKVNELRSLLVDCIKNGRSTPGEPQTNDPIEGEWKQVEWMSEL
ncbi:MAG: arylsulfatase [Bacteroidota bacterium]